VGDLLKDWRRVNVAITRAKTKMIFVGSASTLRGSAVFDRLITSLAQEGRIQRMPSEWVVK
jgi:DNA replication ATP-dependent helicase Dna2